MPITKKITPTSKKSARKYAPPKKRVVIKKTKTSKSLFTEKVENANALLSKAQFLSDLKIAAG